MAIGTPAALGAVQVNFGSGQTSVNFNCGTNIQAGDLVVVFAYWDTAGDPTGVADDHTNAFTKADSANRVGFSYSSIWYFYYSGAPGQTTVTVSGASTADTIVGCYRVSGIADTSPLDQIGGGDNGASNAPATTATGANTQDDVLVVVGLGSNDAELPTTWPPTTGYSSLFNELEDVRSRTFSAAYKIVSAGETSSAASTFTVTPSWAFPLATFKGAAVSGPSQRFRWLP